MTPSMKDQFAGTFIETGKQRPEHDAFGAKSDRLGQVAGLAYASIGAATPRMPIAKYT